MFAEPIALSLKTNDSKPYLRVQLFTGFMYMAAFVSGILSLGNQTQSDRANGSSVWLLRAWKLRHPTLDHPLNSSITNASANDHATESQVLGQNKVERMKTSYQHLAAVTKV